MTEEMQLYHRIYFLENEISQLVNMDIDIDRIYVGKDLFRAMLVKNMLITSDQNNQYFRGIEVKLSTALKDDQHLLVK